MNDVDVGCLVVEDECGHMQGIFTEKDYLKNVFNKGLQSQTTKVADVMRKVPVVASQYFTFRQIMSIFSEEGVMLHFACCSLFHFDLFDH